MDSAKTTQAPDPKTFDAVDAAAFTLGAPAFAVYIYLELKRQDQKRRSFLCSEVREILKIKEHRTLKKYLDAIHDARLATVIFTARGESFLFEKVFFPFATRNVGQVPGDGATEISHDAENFPPEQESLASRTDFSRLKDAKDVGGVLNLKTPTPTPLPADLEGLEDTIRLASLRPITGHQVKLFLGQSVMEAAIKYHSTLTVPGHLLHAWQDAVRYDGKDLVQAVCRVKNAVLYVLQQSEMGIPIRNRIGYFFDSVKRGRTPSVQPERKQALERVRPKERTPEELEQERAAYWKTRSLEDLKNEYELLEKMNLNKPEKTSFKVFMEGVRLSQFGSEFGAWLDARRGA